MTVYTGAVTLAAAGSMVMTTPPSITSGSSASASCTQLFALQTSGTLATTYPFDICGGYPYISTGSGQATFPCVRDGASSGGNLDNSGRRAETWRVRFVTDAPIISIGVLGYSSYRFIVDSGTGPQYASRTPTASPSSGGIQYVTLDFTNAGGALPSGRTITIESSASAAFNHVYVGPLYNVWRPGQADRVKVGVIGDSIAAGTGATYQMDGFAVVLGDYFGANDLWQMGLGGTGYISAGSTWNYSGHTSDWTSYTDWDLLLFTGGNNDLGQTASAVTTAVQNVLTTTRNALPQVPIVVLGPDATSSGPSAAMQSLETAIGAGVTAMGQSTIQFVPLSTTAEGGREMFGTGYVGATNGSGNSDIYTSSDHVHPTDAGHLYRGEFRAARVRAALFSM